jgi:hypothetical protein
VVTARRTEKRRKRATIKAPAFDSFAYALELSKLIPASEVAKAPRDLAANFDHYQDGSPKQE